MLAGIAGIAGFTSSASGGVVATDPNFASVKLLLSGDGVSGSTTFTDESPAAHGNATVAGDAQVSTSLVKFGTGSVRLDGLLDHLSYADSTDWEFGSGAFTIETWALFDAANIEATNILMGQYSATGNQRGWRFYYNGATATNNLVFIYSTNGTALVTPLVFAWTPTANVWYHVAVDRSGNSWRLYIDGAMVASATDTGTIFAPTSLLRIGADETSGLATNLLKGNLDEIRITKGVARYASDLGYAVPTAAFPRA